MKTDNVPTLSDQSLKPRKPKSHEVSSRFFSPTSPSHDNNNGISSPSQPSSPLRQYHKPTTITDARKHRSLEDPGFMRGLWPASSNNKSHGTLADHLQNERREDKLDRKKDEKTENGSNMQKTCSELSRFENEKEIREKEKESTKENHKPFLGGSMRYMGKFRFPGKSSSPSSSSSSSSSKFNSLSHNSDFVPGRLSVDENALYRNFQSSTHASRRKSFMDNPTLESEVGDINSATASPAKNKSSRKPGREVASKYLQSRRGSLDSNSEGPVSLDSSPKMKKLSTIKNAIKRANYLTGYGSATSQWALSPGRSESPPMSVESKERPMSFSSLKPPTSLSRPKGVENLLNLGFDWLKIKKSSLPSSPLAGSGNLESIHHLRLTHNRLMQWRYANARADAVNGSINKQAENNLLCALHSVTKLQSSVLTKKLQLQKERLDMKLDFILRSQIKPLEAWGDMERQHQSSVSKTKECLHSAICRVPLVEGAKMDPQLASLVLRHTQDVTASVKSALTSFSPSVEKTVTLVSQLAEVVAHEKLLLEECLELIQTISVLEIQERSLKSCIIQLNFWQQELQRQQENISS